jgi:hypothetical protein
MSGNPDSRGQRRIDAAAKAKFLAALRRGLRREDAAAEAGFTLMGFYGARSRDPAFKSEWTEALAATAAAERRVSPPAEGGEVRIVPANRRVLQRRRMRQVRFDEGRRQIFLAHFSWSCDAKAAAAEAGVHEATVHNARRTDPGFAEQYRETLEHAYVGLEAEALRQRVEAQQRLRSVLEAEPASSPPVAGEIALEFDRVLKLLARWDRKSHRSPRTASAGGRRRVWTFEAAMDLLEDRLKALGIAVPELPPVAAAQWDGEGPDGEGTVAIDCPGGPKGPSE